jgi:molybdenum cofactor cytidylyltransferase
MGRSKAFLPCGAGQDTFLHRIVASLREGGVEDILVVGRPDDVELIDAVQLLAVPVRFVPNPNHERGQLTSIVAGVNAIDRPGVGGLLVMPVDMPLVRPETFAAVLHASAAHPSAIVRAVCGGRHGHPVIFDRGSFDPLRRAHPSVGAKAVLHACADRVLDIEVPDDGVLKDVDSLDDYVAVFGQAPAPPGSTVPS